MKKLILLIFFPICMLAQGPHMVPDSKIISNSTVKAVAEDNTGWLKNYDQALTNAKEEERNVLVYFTGSDWCPPCKMLKKDLFDTEAFKIIAAEYTLLYVDIPRNKDLLSEDQMVHNSKLLSKINKKGVFPLLVILNETGTQLDQYSGYSMNGKVQAHLDFLEKYKD